MVSVKRFAELFAKDYFGGLSGSMREINECVGPIEKKYFANYVVIIPHFLYRSRVIPHVILRLLGTPFLYPLNKTN